RTGRHGFSHHSQAQLGYPACNMAAKYPSQSASNGGCCRLLFGNASYGLMRGKRHAWRLTVLLLLMSALLHVLRVGSVLATAMVFVLATLLVVFFRYFQARSDPPSIRRGYLAFIMGLGVVTFYTFGGFLALYTQFRPL